MAELLRKHEAEEAIVDAAVSYLNTRTGVGQPLADVAEIIRGDYTGSVSLPCIWVVDAESRAAGGTMTTVQYEMDLMLQSEVKAKDSVKGSKMARALASMAAEELLKDATGRSSQRLGLPNTVVRMDITRSERGPVVDETNYTFLTVVRITFSARM